MFKRFLKFGIVGGFGTIVNLVIFALLSFAGINSIISAIVSFIVAATFNYILNSLWVFKDRGHNCTKTLWVKFMCVSVFSLCINLIVLFIMERYIMPMMIKWWLVEKIMQITAGILNVKTISKIIALYSQAVGIACSMIFNFIGNNCITFKKK
ncbi:MAG: GtrA family protein [Alphaproteobacteria bacterium]